VPPNNSMRSTGKESMTEMISDGVADKELMGKGRLSKIIVSNKEIY
jgi:hypothetical protein